MLYQWQAALVVLVNGHAVQALETLAVVDLAAGLNGLVFAAVAAGLARCAAGLAAWNPRPALQDIRGGQCRTQRADVAAVATVDKHAQGDAGHSPQHIRPLVHKVQADGGFEGLDFHRHFSERRRGPHRPHDDREHGVFDPLQLGVDGRSQATLANAHRLRDHADEFLQSAKWTQPAAEGAPPPHQQGARHKNPQDHRHRVVHEEAQVAAMAQFIQSCGDVDDGELPLCVPTDEAHGEQQIGGTQQLEALGVGTQAFLHDEARGQHHQASQQSHHFPHPVLPRLVPTPAGPIGVPHIRYCHAPTVEVVVEWKRLLHHLRGETAVAAAPGHVEFKRLCRVQRCGVVDDEEVHAAIHVRKARHGHALVVGHAAKA